MTATGVRVARVELAAAGVLLMLKLWLVRAQALTAIGDSPGDDRLYLELASQLTQGHWLGEYRSLTLAKNPFYPMWVAATFGAGLPLLLAEQLLYAAAAALVAVAVAPALPRPGWRWAVFAVLVFDPISFADGAMTRAAREGIYPALALLVFAGCAGVATRLPSSPTAVARWAALLGGALSALLLCREEGVWIAPLVAVTAAAGLEQRQWRRVALAAAVAGTVTAAATGAVLWQNWRHYGVAVLNEQSQGAFPRAYGAVARVRHARWRRYVPAPRETRQRIYAASPRFAELAPSIEGPDLGAWMAPGCRWFGICDEVYTGLFLWQMRAAAASAGHFRSGAEAAAFWNALADEVNAACDSGRLDCDPPRSTLAPPWRREYLPLVVDALRRAAPFVATFQDVTPYPTPSSGSASQLVIFRDLTRERLAGADVFPRQQRLDERRLAILAALVRAYRLLLPPAALLALVGWALALARCLRRRAGWVLPLLSAGAFAGFLSRVAVLSAVDAMVWPGIIVLYLSAAYPLLAGFVVLGLACLDAPRAGQRQAETRP